MPKWRLELRQPDPAGHQSPFVEVMQFEADDYADAVRQTAALIGDREALATLTLAQDEEP
jgi:hypothetical protein